MATIVNDRDVLLQAALVRLETVLLNTNIQMPAVKGILLTAPSLIFQVATGGTPSPSSILLTATLKQVTGTIAIGVIAGSATLTSVTANTATLLYANMSSDSVTIRAQVTENAITYTSDLTIAKLRDGVAGASAATAYLVQSQASAAPAVTPNPTTGSAVPTGWSGTFSAPGAGQSLWAIDGTYSAVTNQTTWSPPYLTQGVTTTIQSDNFVLGVSGWRIKRDTGDCEFNNGKFRGDITGGANINITGTATFEGGTPVAGFTWGCAANTGGGADGGAYGTGVVGVKGLANGALGSYGVWGVGASLASSVGVVGNSATGGIGVKGTGDSASAVGGEFSNSSGGVALSIPSGSFKWFSNTWTAPTGSPTKFLCDDGTWKDLTALIKFISSGNATAGAAQGYLVIDTLGAAGQVKIPYYAL